MKCKCFFSGANVPAGSLPAVSKAALSGSAKGRIYNETARKWHSYTVMEDTDGSGKTRIIWGNENQPNPYDHTSKSTSYLHTESDEPGMKVDVYVPDAESKSETKDSVSEPLTPYAIGNYVEYYSWSHRKWVLGVFQGITGKGRGYIVDIVRGQRRLNVHMDCLRSPFQANDLVEVFSKSKGWLPGIVIGCQDPKRATRHGYKVQVIGDRTLENIPAERLRHRFPAGLSLEVWRGRSNGWVAASVHPDRIAPDGCGAQSLLDSQTPSLITRSKSRDSETSATLDRTITRLPSLDSTVFEQVEKEFTITEQVLEPWVAVPVFEGATSNADSADTVPSYILRKSSRKVYRL